MHIFYFLDAERNFSLLNDFIVKNKMVAIFEENNPLRYRVIDCNKDDLRREYLRRGKRELYISLSKKPRSSRDMNFTDEAANQLLVFSGGRQKGRTIEVSYLLVYSKKSRVKKHYRKLRSRITSICSKHDLRSAVTGTVDKQTYYDPSADFVYMTQLNNPRSELVRP